MKEKQWWDASKPKEKKPYGHSVAFLQKQTEKAKDKAEGFDKFELENRPYFMPIPEAIYAPGRAKMVSRIEKGLAKAAKRGAEALRAIEPKKKPKVEFVTLKDGYARKEIREDIDLEE